MDQKEKEEDKKGVDGEEEDVIPSSQGEMFSSQSSTPDLLSPSCLIPILQPSQSISGTDTSSIHHPRVGDLLASTPSGSRPSGADRSLVEEVHLDLSATPSEIRLDMSATPSEVRLDLSDAPSEEQQSARRRRSDTAGGGADDSDVMFVEEVDPDVQVVFNSQPGEPATPSATAATAAESQVGFRLSLSPSQSEEVSQLPLTRVSPAVGADSEVDVVTRHSSEEAPGGSAAGPSSALAPDSEVDVVSQDAGGGGGASWSAGQPPDESGSQGFQPPPEPPPDSESISVRLPHIQTPQVGSSGDSSSEIAGDTVFGHAQRLIDEQNRRRQLREQEPPPPPPPVPPVLAVESEEPPCPPAPTAESNGTSESVAVKSNERGSRGEGALKSSAAPVESCVGPPTAAAAGERERSASSPPAVAEAAAEEQTADGPADDSQRGSQTTDMSLLSAWRSVMKSPGHTVDTSADPPQQDAAPPPPGPQLGPTSKTAAAGRRTAAAAVEKAASAAAATATETPEQLAAAGAEAGAEDPDSEVVQESPDLAEEPLPDVSSGYDPFRFHGTQSQETQPYRLRVKPKISHTANKSTSTAAASPPAEPADASFQRRMAEIQAEARRLSEEGFGLVELQLTWRREDKEVVRAFSLDEHDGAAFLRRVASSSMSSSGSSVLGSSTTTAGGHAADVSSSSSKSGASVIAARNKRQSTLSSVTLSTIEGRGARHSVSSSVEVGMAAGRRSIMSVQPCSPPSDGEVQYLSPPAPRLAPVPEFTSPDGRPPRPHGQPTAVSSLRSRLDESADQSAMGALPGVASQPAATSTQVDPRPGPSLTTTSAAAAAAASSQDSGASHVTGSSPSPELPLQAPLPPRPLTDAEEEALSEREQSELPRRQLQPDTPCFALWGADKTYYPGRLVSEGRGGRWLVRFDDGTERQVLTDRILPVVNLWKGLSVFVKNQPDTYEAGIITGHRLATGNEPLEYIVSLDSHPNVTSAVPRSWLSLTLDQAALVRERRHPSLGQLAVGSPSRDLSLDNLVTGRRRAAGAVAGRRLANFEASSSDAPAEPARDAATSRASRRAGSKPSLSRRKPGGKGKEARTAAPSANDTNGPEGGAEAGVAAGAETGAGTVEQDSAGTNGAETRAEPPATAEAAGDTTTSSRAGGRKKKTPARGKRSTPQRLSRTRTVATPDLSDVTAAEVESPAAAGARGKRGRGRPASTPSATPATAGTSSAAAPATPSGRGRKRIAASSTPTDEPTEPAATATPSGRGRKRIAASSTPTDEPAEATTAVATPSGRERKRAGSSAQPEEPTGSAATAATPSGRGRKRGNTSAQAEEPAAKRTSTSAPRSPRKASPRSASPRKASGSEGARSPRKASPRNASPRKASGSEGTRSPRKASPRKASGSEGARSPRKASEGGRSPRKASAPIASPVSGAGGRGRKRAAASTASSPEAPTPPGAARGGGKSRKRLALAASALESPTDSSSSREHVGVVPAPIPGAATAVNRSSEKAQKAVAPVRPLGEVPDVPTTLLSKHTFILTCGDSGPAAAAQRKRMKIDIKPPFDKEHVSAHITAHGGHVLSDTVLTAAAVQRMRGRGDLLLLANGPLRTAKYIAALAMGVPCVLYSWLQDSLRLKQCLPYEDYLLPAGHDPGTGEPLEQLVGAPPPLARLRVLLAADKHSEWGQMMGHVLAAAGATVKTDIKDPASVSAEEAFPADVVVAEADCPAPVLDWARQCTTPVVSGEWVIGSVIAHRRLGYTDRPEFGHNATPRPPTDDA